MLTKRTFTQTHPWIKFDLGADRFSPEIWMLLGEATSKANHIAGVPLAPEVAQQLLQLFMAKGAAATTAIEGNTLTEAQVLSQLKGELKLPPSQEYLQQEVQNVLDTYQWICRVLDTGPVRRFDADFCCEINKRILAKLELDEGVEAGRVRQHNVVVGSVYRGAPAEDCQYLLEQMCEHIEGFNLDRQQEAILAALFAHIYVALIHPFGDGNGRTARMIEVYILMRASFAQPVGHLLSNHYNKTRSVYYRELDKISKTGGDARGFVHYALQGFVDGLKEQIALIRSEQMRVAWVQYVHSMFMDSKSPTEHRRRDLVLAISAQSQPVRQSQLQILTPELAMDYADKGPKTQTRDINALLAMGLIVRVPGRRFRAKTEIIKAWLPWRVENHSHKEAA